MATANDKVFPLDQRSFRSGLGHYPRGVSALTVIQDANAPVLMIVGSFTSASLDPPLFEFPPAKSSTSRPRGAQTRDFCVNVLAADQENVCRRLPSREPEVYALVQDGASLDGPPTIAGAIKRMDCHAFEVMTRGTT